MILIGGLHCEEITNSNYRLGFNEARNVDYDYRLASSYGGFKCRTKAWRL